MIIRLILLLVLGVVFSTIEGFGQIRTKEGLNINLYSTGSKKPLKIENIEVPIFNKIPDEICVVVK